MLNKDRLTNYCLICGYEQGEPPWGEDGCSPNCTICSCCGSESGYHDWQIDAAKSNRLLWLSKGANWFEPKEKPANWSLEEQLKNIPEAYK